MKLSFSDFWGDFSHNNNFFVDLLKSMRNDIEVVPLSNETDVLIYTCFGSQHHSVNRNKTKKIFYTGENKRPNYNECDYSFTFDFDSYDDKNIRIPLWLLQINFFNKTDYGNPNYTAKVDYLNNIKSNPHYYTTKDKFCVIVNNHLSNRREEVLRLFCKKKETHGYGNIFNNWFYGETQKIDILSKFKFNMCFENTIHPGYYTEKLIHAKAGCTIPIYYSDSNVEQDFNIKSFINLNDFDSAEKFVDRVLEIDSNDDLYKQIQHEPLFKTPDYPYLLLENIKHQISKIIL